MLSKQIDCFIGNVKKHASQKTPYLKHICIFDSVVRFLYMFYNKCTFKQFNRNTSFVSFISISNLEISNY